MFEDLLKRLALGLEQAGLPYAIFGGQAVLLYGEPRLTRDVDVCLALAPDQAGPLLRLLADLKLRVLVDDVQGFLAQTFVLPVLDPASDIRIDFVFSLSEYERHAVRRAKLVQVEGVRIRYVALEDLIVMKVVAGRPRDLEDVAAVVLKNPEFDRSYVEQWLSAFDAELDSQFLLSFDQLLQETLPKRTAPESGRGMRTEEG